MTENSNIENKIEELKIENDRLRKENELKTGWISLISHDFKEAFGSLFSLIELLENKAISEVDFFTLLPQVKQDTQKNINTINDTGTWIKTQGDSFNPQLIEINAVELFAQLKQELQSKLQNKQLQFTFQGDETIMISTDKLLISFILKKIVDNAIKYSHPDSSIYFKVINTKNKVVISIIDHGIGMDKKQTETVFSFDSPVFRGTQGEIGAGLSLKIVKNFIYLVHGKIEIESSDNKGTTVSIHLPKH